MTGIELITQERDEQITKHQKTKEHDLLKNGLAQLQAGAMGLLAGYNYDMDKMPETPRGWDEAMWNKALNKSTVERLKIAGALLAAEIDRLQAMGLGGSYKIDLKCEGYVMEVHESDFSCNTDTQPWDVLVGPKERVLKNLSDGNYVIGWIYKNGKTRECQAGIETNKELIRQKLLTLSDKNWVRIFWDPLSPHVVFKRYAKRKRNPNWTAQAMH